MVKNLLTPGQALKRVFAKEVAPIHAFFGEEYFFQDLILDGISDIVLPDNEKKNIFIMGIDNEEDFLNLFNSNSLFSQQSVIVVKNAKKIKPKFYDEIIDYCKNPSLDNYVVFIFNDPYSTNKFVDSISAVSTCVDMRTPFPNKMREWVKYYCKKNNFILPDVTLNNLVDNYGDNVSNVINEIDKLYLHSLGKIEDVDLSIDININKKESQVWKLMDSIGKKNTAESINIYTQLYNNNTPMIKILLNLLDLFKELINQKLKIKEGKFIRNKIILRNLNIYGRKFSAEQILKAVTLLRDCDLIIKSTSISEKYFFYSIIVEICEDSGE